MNRREVLRAGLLAGAQALAAPLLGPGIRRLLAEPVEGPRRLRGFRLPREAPVSARADELVRRTTVVDMLSLPTLDWARLRAWESEPRSLGQADLARLRASGIRVFHSAVDVNDEVDPHAAALRWMAGWNRLIDGHRDTFVRVDGAAELERVRTEDRIGLLLGFQNATHFRTPADVALFHALGQRVSQLTYNERNRLGGGCHDPEAGLTQFGATVVAAMNQAGMAVDLAHCGERTSLDAMEASTRPVVISHSNCRALVANRRCASDAVIRALAAKGGVIGLTVLPMMVSGGRTATLGEVLDHFDHVARLVGVEHVGLGSDTDVDAVDPRTGRVRAGYDVRGMRHELRVFEIADGLLRRSYAPADVAGILGGNFQRVLTAIWGA